MNAPWAPHPGQQQAALEAALFGQGFCIARNIVPAATAKALSRELDDRFERTGFCDGFFFGHRTKRFNGLLKRSRHAAELVLNDLVLALVSKALKAGPGEFQLNLTQAIEIHPGEKAQAPHRDQDMWPRAAPGVEYLVNVMWPLTPFDAENGGTRLWPRTNLDLAQRRPRIGEAVVAEMEPGDALIHLGSTIHGAGANRSAAPRRGMVAGYSLGWLKASENMSLTYPPEIARRLPRRLADLIGYRRHTGNLGNYDGKCPSILLERGHDEFSGATETLSAEQNRVLERFAQRQDWS